MCIRDSVSACAGQTQAQEFKLFDHTVQVHGFVSQGFVYTNDNNWLTMNTSDGSAAMTDFALNMSSQLTDKLRVGAQGYDRNLGQLGQYHPSLDWALADCLLYTSIRHEEQQRQQEHQGGQRRPIVYAANSPSRSPARQHPSNQAMDQIEEKQQQRGKEGKPLGNCLLYTSRCV